MNRFNFSVDKGRFWTKRAVASQGCFRHSSALIRPLKEKKGDIHHNFMKSLIALSADSWYKGGVRILSNDFKKQMVTLSFWWVTQRWNPWHPGKFHQMLHHQSPSPPWWCWRKFLCRCPPWMETAPITYGGKFFIFYLRMYTVGNRRNLTIKISAKQSLNRLE